MKFLSCVLLVIAWCGNYACAQREILRLKQGSVDLVVSSPFSEIPPSGYFPVHIRVGNGSRAAFDHTFTSSGQGSHYSNRSTGFTQRTQISVPPGEDRSFQISAPVSNVGTQSYANTRLDVSLVDNQSVSTSFSGTRGPFIIATEEAMGRRRSQIESDVNGTTGGSSSASFTMVSAPSSLLPEDGRVWFGINELWITPAEWRKLRPAQQLCLRDWVTRGGRVVVWSGEPDDGLATELSGAGGRATQTEGQSVVRLGFGEFLFPVVPGDEEAMVKEAVAYLKGGGTFRPAPLEQSATNLLSQQYTDWDLFRVIPKLRVNVPLTILFVVVFAVLVGPINLFIFANAKNRYRMFWTTPLLSLGASLILALLIVVVDGFGAMGNRGTLIYINGDENRASTFQEQVIRTGVLINRAFSVPGAVAVQPLKVGREEPGADYSVSNGVYDGSWFASRALCGLYLETTDAFRGKVEILNQAAFDSGEGKVAPEIVSSLPLPLKILEVVDSRGNIWRGRDLSTGERRTLELAGDGGLLAKQEAENTLGPINRVRLNRLSGSTNMFYASAEGAAAFTETLAGVRWEKQPAFYAGSLE